MVLKAKLLLGLLLVGLLMSFGPPSSVNMVTSGTYKDKYNIYEQSEWVDSTLATMTLDEKIGQLFMVSAFSSKDKMNLPELKRLVDDYHVGGVIFFKGTPVKQAEMTNYLQERSFVPLLVGIDAEWGLAMRLDSTINFGYQMPMGAIREDSLIYKMGEEMAYQCKRMGIQVNFAPVVDVNNNPLNPVINLRSFSENKDIVAHKSYLYMKGMQDAHVLAVAKHFPGHGNTDVDSHLDLPVLNQSSSELDTLELYPFRYLFARGVGGVMTAHLHIPAFDTAACVGASLSHNITTDLLRGKMHFRGLAFSDALNMKGVSKFYQPGQLELAALVAGNDVLLCSEDVPRAIQTIRQAVDMGCIDEEIIDMHVKRILAVKYWTGLNECRYVSLYHLTQDLNNDNALLIKQKLAEQAITVVKDNNKLIPLRRPDTCRIASIAIGTVTEPVFQNMLRMYARADYFTIPMNAPDTVWKVLRDTLKNYDLAIISLHNLSNRRTSTYGMSDNAVSFVQDANKLTQSILVSFGSPYALSRFPDFGQIIEGYQDEKTYQTAAAQVLFGGLQASGRLPVTSGSYPLHAGVTTPKPFRLQYTVPEEMGITSSSLSGIDTIVKGAINNKVMPGCQILVAFRGKVIYNKSFGSQTYDNGMPVKNSDLYDIASVTKVASTTLAAMRLYDQGKLSIFKDLDNYLPELDGTDKGKLQIKEVMTHQAGLTPWIPFYKRTLSPTGLPDSSLYSKLPDSMHTIRVADSMYINKGYADSILEVMNASELNDKGKYHYSDLGFMYMQKVVERISGMPLDRYVDSTFYRPLSLATLTYKPREKFPLERIIPTEKDTYFRHQLIRGDVHDPAAALLGGVSGHAGLFSDANDLAVLMQMLLNDGTYAGVKYLSPSTVKLFTSQQYNKNRRGLGWDKPSLDLEHGSPASQYASPHSFGHTGFTGTCVWADPDYDLVFIFLSNRVYPSAENNLLAKYNIRTDIHDIIYRAILKECQ